LNNPVYIYTQPGAVAVASEVSAEPTAIESDGTNNDGGFLDGEFNLAIFDRVLHLQ
jgi:hypothetical protein